MLACENELGEICRGGEFHFISSAATLRFAEVEMRRLTARVR